MKKIILVISMLLAIMYSGFASQKCEAKELTDEYREVISISAEDHGIDEYIVLALIEKESRNNPDAVNAEGTCYGLCQIHKCWKIKAKNAGYGDVLTDPVANIQWCCNMLSDYYTEYEDWNKALVVYNAGYLYADSSSYSRHIVKRAEELRLKDYNEYIHSLHP